MEKHKNDNVNTFDTNISVMCKDILDYLEQELSGDLISRSGLIDAFNNKNVQITFDLPVEEVLGEDVDLDDFAMLVQDAIQAYKKMVIDTIKNQPTAYDIDKVVNGLEEAKHEICLSDDDLEHYQNGIDKAIEIVKQKPKTEH